jgi:hypothetical protein
MKELMKYLLNFNKIYIFGKGSLECDRNVERKISSCDIKVYNFIQIQRVDLANGVEKLCFDK